MFSQMHPGLCTRLTGSYFEAESLLLFQAKAQILETKQRAAELTQKYEAEKKTEDSNWNSSSGKV